MKNILIVAYYFSPYAGITARTEKHCKYLPKFGWNPWVFTVDPKYYNGKVISENIFKLDSIYQIPYLKLPFTSLLSKIFFPLSILIYVVLNYKKLNAVYFTGSPYHPFILTTIITGILKIPSILDFRDSWSINHGYDGSKEKGFISLIKEKIFFFVESISIHYASTVIFSTSTLQSEYEQLIPKYKNKYHTITNGFDPEDFTNIKPIKSSEGKSIILTGSFYLYTPDVVVYIMKSLKEFPDITFVYMGNEQKIITKLASQYNVSKQVIAYSYQPYKKALKLIAGADYCVVTNGMVNGLGTKIFDYLALSKPTLCFVPKRSIITKMLGSLDNVIICEPKYTVDTVRISLKKLIDTNISDNSQLLQTFTREEATKKLVFLLSNIIKGEKLTP